MYSEAKADYGDDQSNKDPRIYGYDDYWTPIVIGKLVQRCEFARHIAEASERALGWHEKIQQ